MTNSVDPATQNGNLLDRIESTVASHSPSHATHSLRIRSSQRGGSDLTLFFGDDTSPDDVRKLEGILAGDPIVERAQRKGKRVSASLTKEAIGEFGSDLSSESPTALDATSIAKGKRFFVDYGDPNVTKALHVGHLRCISLGHSIARTLESAGGEVTTLSLLNDIGRNICEAMAGYQELGAGETPASTGEKSDAFVGRLYAEYVRSLTPSDRHEGTLNAPFGRELDERQDLAASLLKRWSEGEPEALALWNRVREWVLEGQFQTLERLGARLDRPLYESKALERARLLLEEGLSKGIFRREPDGVVYDTGRSEYEHMPLLRADGFPTENLRLAAIFYELQQEGAGLDACIHVMGDEWVPLISCREQMLPRFRPCPLYDVYHKVGYAMVTFKGSKMKSSTGEALLIDELFDRVESLDAVGALARSSESPEAASGDLASREVIARIVLLGFYLGRRPAKSIEYSWEVFTDPKHNPSWALAEAWSRAVDRAPSAQGRPDPSDPAYRFAVLQAQCLKSNVAKAAETFDVLPTISFLGHLASWYVQTDETDPHIDLVMRSTMRAGLSSLGLL